MKVIDAPIPGLKIIEPSIFRDGRGFFMESYNQNSFNDLVKKDVHFVQDNHSRSKRNVLRGLHYQIKKPQGKLVRVVSGEIFDVAVDLRESSTNFGSWYGIHLSAENSREFWIPEGFAHGFLVLSEYADLIYKTTDYYAPNYDRTIMWNDASIGIEWPDGNSPILSEKDKRGMPFNQAEVFT